MKVLFSLLATAVLLPFWSTAQNKPDHFEVAGNIKGLQNDSVYVIYSRPADKGEGFGADTLRTKASKDQFYLKGLVSLPGRARAQLGGVHSRKGFSFYMEKGRVVIDGSLDALEDLSITGTPNNNDYTRSQQYTSRIYERMKPLREVIKNQQQGSEEFKRLAESLAQMSDSIIQYRKQFVKAHPGSLVSVDYLYVLQDRIPDSEVESLYEGLHDWVKANQQAVGIYSQIKARKAVAVGNRAPDFVSFDTSSRAVKLSDFKGKYVLLEFWAHWCVPCRKQSPHFVEIYNKYSNKGFTILQFSLDIKKDEAKWKDAIVQDGLVWTNISNVNGLGDKVAALYGVQPIPDNFLIDPNGIIVGKRLSPEKLEAQLSQIFK